MFFAIVLAISWVGVFVPLIFIAIKCAWEAIGIVEDEKTDDGIPARLLITYLLGIAGSFALIGLYTAFILSFAVIRANR